MRLIDDLVYAIHSHPQFDLLIEALKAARPIVPSHDPGNDNTEQWKQRSAQQAGFDLCLSLFKITMEK